MVLLSYPLNLFTPSYGNLSPFILKNGNVIKNGDTCNSLNLRLSNHIGTHIDCPRHFYTDGKTITDYEIDFWICTSVQVLTVELLPGEIFGKNHFSKVLRPGSKSHNAEIVLLKTGWGNVRHKHIYWENPPGFDPETCLWLKEKFPHIRFFGFDLISLSSFAHRDVGREAHKSFLDPSFSILPIEDMNLSDTPKERLENILISPLFVESSDAAPCTVWGNI